MVVVLYNAVIRMHRAHYVWKRCGPATKQCPILMHTVAFTQCVVLYLRLLCMVRGMSLIRRAWRR